MSKQRKVHPMVVAIQKAKKHMDRNEDWYKIMRLMQSKYRGTQFRGLKRWK